MTPKAKPKATPTTPAGDFSPGPWTRDNSQIRDRDGWSLGSIPYSLGGPGDVDNGRLMAAAPDLAQALADMLGAVNCNYDPQTVRYEGIAERARLALERAGWPLGRDSNRAAFLLLAAAPQLLKAAESALAVLNHISPDDFKLGKDKPAREALEAAVKLAGGEDTTEYPTYRAMLYGAALRDALEAVLKDPADIEAQEQARGLIRTTYG